MGNFRGVLRFVDDLKISIVVWIIRRCLLPFWFEVNYRSYYFLGVGECSKYSEGTTLNNKKKHKKIR